MEIGIIGAGWWAARAYIPMLQGHPLVTGIAVCRPDREGLDVLGSKLGVQHRFLDAAEMLESRPLSGVIVSSPHVLHAEHALMCIARGLPLLVEKPMATTADEVRLICKAADEKPAPVVVAYGWNFRPIVAAARHVIQDGWVGDLAHATCVMATATTELFSGLQPPGTRQDLFRPGASTWADPQRAGGYAWGQLSHALGLLFLLVDDWPSCVFARMRESETGVDISNAAVIELQKGATVVASGTAALPRQRRKHLEIRMFGSEGMLLLDLERVALEASRFDGRRHVHTATDRDGDYDTSDLLDSFVRLCAGERVENYATATVGAQAVVTIEAMHHSAQRGRAIRVGV